MTEHSGSKDLARKPERECPVCGTFYEYDAHRLAAFGRGSTCSRSCSYVYRAQLKRRGQDFTCPVCQRQFSRSPAQIKSKHESVFCSRACHYRGRSLGLTKRVVTKPYDRIAIVDWKAVSAKAWETRRRLGKDKHSDETRARLRETTARSIAARTSTTSKLEDIVAAVLDGMGVAYVRQVAIRGPGGRFVAVADFWLPDWEVFLEVNGTFWHTDSRTYPTGPIHAIQIRNAEAWQRKLRAYNLLGFPLAVVWEADIRNDAGQAVEAALDLVA